MNADSDRKLTCLSAGSEVHTISGEHQARGYSQADAMGRRTVHKPKLYNYIATIVHQMKQWLASAVEWVGNPRCGEVHSAVEHLGVACCDKRVRLLFPALAGADHPFARSRGGETCG